MTVTKTWSVNTLQRELADGYVNKVIFRVIGEDGVYKSTVTGEVNLEKPETLIPYADLTEETVLDWIKVKLNSEKDADDNTIDKVASIEAAVENGVNIQKKPTHGTGKPW